MITIDLKGLSLKDFEKIKQLMKEKNIKQIELVNKLGVARSNVSSWLSGTRSIPKEKIIDIAKLLNINAEYLLSSTEIKPVAKVPVTGTASCGASEDDMLQEKGRTCYYNGDYFHDGLYCVIANGDSMAPDIENGDEVICDPRVTPVHGDMVHYQINGESAIKVLVKDEEAYLIRLKPYNPSPTFKTRTIRLDDDEANELTMTKVVAVNKLHFNNRAARLRLVGE